MAEKTTTLYLIRHAESDNNVHDNRTRPLTENGRSDAVELAEMLGDIQFDALYSSPYQRAIDTIKPLASKYSLEIETIDDFRERKPADVWVEDFSEFMARQWGDFTYKLPGGESLGEVQERFTAALNAICCENPGKTIAIASHGTALCAALSYYDPSVGFKEFHELVNVTPFVVRLEFVGEKFQSWEKLGGFYDNTRN